MGRMVKGAGATIGGGGARTAVLRGTQMERPWGEGTPSGKALTFARFMGIHIIQTEAPGDADPLQAMLDAWHAWRSDPANERYRILDLVFDHYYTPGDEEGFLLYITYSQ